MSQTVVVTLPVSSSVDLLARAQTPWGSIPASTGHEVYQFAWLRDGSWCAYALDVAGRHEQSGAWHRWVARTLLDHRARFEEACDAVRRDRVTGAVMMPARFTLDGHEEVPDPDDEEEWPNFQTDCYGFWLWALADHVDRGGSLDNTLTAAAELVVRYLLVAGQTPCFDCWEEHPGNVHTSSLAAVAAGLRAAGRVLGDDTAVTAAADITALITGPEHTLGGAFIRFPGDTRVDGSLLWLAAPFALVELDDPTFVNTVTRIEQELVVPGGGVRRYLGDTFYGGSEWILLAATLGWVRIRRGDAPGGMTMLNWIEAAANADGLLPEQRQDHVQSPYMLNFWREKWGQTATPLLWSHAMYIVLDDVIRNAAS